MQVLLSPLQGPSVYVDLSQDLRLLHHGCSPLSLIQSAFLQVAFPYLYNNRPRKVRLSIYHHPMVMYIKTEDPELPAFYFDPLIHPISSDKTEVKGTRDDITPEEEEEFELPGRVEPLLNDYPVSTEGVAAGIALLWAPEPFNKRSGRTRRAVDVPLVGSWFQVCSYLLAGFIHAASSSTSSRLVRGC